MKSFIPIFLLFFCAQYLWPQKYSFKNYTHKEGLSSPILYDIQQDKNGYLWIASAEKLFKFDGINFYPINITDSSTSFVRLMFSDSKKRIWLALNDGSLYLKENETFQELIKKNELGYNIVEIIENRFGYIMAFFENGEIIYFNNLLTELKTIKLNLNQPIKINSVLALNNYNFLLGADNGLYKMAYSYKNNTVKSIYRLNNFPDCKVNKILHCNQTSIIVTEEYGIYAYWNEALNRIIGLDKIDHCKIQTAVKIDKEHIWLGTFGHGVYVIKRKNALEFTITESFNIENGLPSNLIKQIFKDVQENIWFVSFDKGLIGLVDNSFQFINFPASNNIKAISCIDSILFTGIDNSIYAYNTKLDNPIVKVCELNIDKEDQITSLVTRNEELWIGTENHSVFVYHLKKKTLHSYYNPENNSEKYISHIALQNNNVLLSTNAGVILIKPENKEIKQFSTNTGLLHNKINHVFADNNEAWVSTRSNSILSLFSENKYKVEGIIEIEFMAITKQKDKLFSATYGNGVLGFLNDSLTNITTQQGLLSDYCYAIISTPDNNIWVGHRNGLSKILSDNQKINTYSINEGIKGDVNQNAMYVSPEGILYIGTTQGLISYDYRKDNKNKMPPIVNITSIKISDNEFMGKTSILLPYGIHRLRFEFNGISLSNPEKVKYQYLLQGWDSEWSDINSSNSAYYPRIADGKYVFLVRAYNSEGVYASNEEHPIIITIRPPLWKQWWFIFMCISLLMLSFYLVIYFRERRHIATEKHLEKMLSERTIEVVKQKEELEIKNKDITDSINYARRIQSSLLPSREILKQYFDENLLFYLPRDIVSGDFYWFQPLNKNEILIVCADSTGHGVPGAFMSIIGITAIKEIIANYPAIEPSQLLNKLDIALRNTLNQDCNSDQADDGIDIAIIKYYKVEKKLVFSSAMRPAIMYRNEKLEQLEISKRTVGGSEIIRNSEYLQSEFIMHERDILYLYSDGYSDQFGGPDNKKMKMYRVKELLNSIHHKNMTQQHKDIKDYFFDWKGSYEQVDDVLFMGIRI